MTRASIYTTYIHLYFGRYIYLTIYYYLYILQVDAMEMCPKRNSTYGKRISCKKKKIIVIIKRDLGHDIFDWKKLFVRIYYNSILQQVRLRLTSVKKTENHSKVATMWPNWKYFCGKKKKSVFGFIRIDFPASTRWYCVQYYTIYYIGTSYISYTP